MNDLRKSTCTRLVGAVSFSLLFFVVLLILVDFLIRRRKTLQHHKVVRKNKEDFVNILIPDYSEVAVGHVGVDNSLNESGQQLVRNKIDTNNNSGSSCDPKGVAMPPEWRPSKNPGTCSLDMYSHIVRNQCSQNNKTLFPEGGVIDDAYIDPSSHRCVVKFGDQASSQQIDEFKKEVDVGYLLGMLEELRDKVASLERERERLANLKTELERTKRENEEKIDALEEDIVNLEREIEDLENELKQLGEKEDELEAKLIEVRQNLSAAISGTKMNFSLNGKHWKLDGNNIRLNRGVPMCLTIKGDDSRIHNSAGGMVAFFHDDDSDKAVRHTGYTMYAQRFNSGPDYDFAYRVQYDASGGVVLLNDYGGTSYVGYDESRDEVRIYTASNRKEVWKMEQCSAIPNFRIGPSSPRAISGGWCCTHNGIRFYAKQPLRLGKTIVEANRSGGITVRLSHDHDKLNRHVVTKTFELVKGTQTIDLDMTISSAGRYFLWHDRNASRTRWLQLYRSDSPSQVPKLLRDYQGIIQVYNMYNAAYNITWNRYWYSFHNIEVFVDGGGGLPISTNGRCGPNRGTRCPGSQCCSVFDWCGGGNAHCDRHVRSDTSFHGPDWKPAATLTLGKAHEPLASANNVSSSDFLRIDQNNPDPTKFTSSFDSRLRYFGSRYSRWQDTPFNYFLILRSGKTPPLKYEFQAPSTGAYTIEAYVIAPNPNTDSFYIQIDNGGKDWWDLYPAKKVGFTTYKTVNLSQGVHSITFHGREPTGLAAVRVSRNQNSGNSVLATVYKHCNYRGRKGVINKEGQYNIDWINRAVGNDEMSSVRVAPGYEVQLFQHSNFRGRSITTRSNISCLTHRSMNDTVSSIIVRRI